MQTAGYLINGIAELTARMQYRIYDTCRRNLLGRVDVHRNAAAVIDNRNPAVLL